MGSALIVMLKADLERKEINDIIASIKDLPGVVSVEEEEDDDSESILSEVPSSPIIVAQTRVEETRVTETTIAIHPAYHDKPGVIYEYHDPDSDIPVYVGKTTDFEERVRAHLRDARKPNLQKWLYLQITRGKLPIVVEVAKGENNRELERLERERIKLHTDNGIILLNRTSGNDSLLDDVVVRRLPQP